MRRKGIAVLATAVAAMSVAATVPPALASSSSPAPLAAAVAERVPSNAEAMRRAIAGLPSADATAAQVRLGGTDGRWLGTSGEADIRTHRAPKGDERFRAGSITKTFTAAVVLQLVHEGKVRLDGTVQHYLPGLLPAHYPEIRVSQLLNYTSGLPSADFPADFAWQYAHRFTTWDHKELVSRAVSRPMEFAPGTKQHYSNIGYNVLGLIVEKVTGRSYEREVRDRVIIPAGLKDTYSAGNDTGIQGRHTRGYQAVKAKDGSSRLVDVTEWNQSITWASGDLITTTADLERFSSALFRGRVVPKPELKLMFTVPDVPAYNPGGDPAEDRKATYTSGLTRVEVGRTVVYGKTGGRYGYLNGFGATPDRSRTLVYSVNSTDAKSETPSPVVGRIIEAGFGQ
ncbi:serine hydrolase domain-containing protein [Streptomyces syringium]|uniref:serine hydrolase domain-containing protein n=1 Tax=Streptomyces syringium TaxID=76729 RepID=UPI003D91D820